MFCCHPFVALNGIYVYGYLTNRKVKKNLINNQLELVLSYFIAHILLSWYLALSHF